MPLFTEGQDPLDTSAASIRQPLGRPETRDPFETQSAGDVIGAAFRQANPVASVWNALSQSDQSYELDPNHNPRDLIKGTWMEQQHLDAFMGSPNADVTRSIMGKLESERKDRETLRDAGGWGTVAEIGAGLVDPTMYIPLIGGAAAFKAGMGIAKTAGVFAATGALQSGVSEFALQASQAGRSGTESAVNIATNTVLMGIIGGAAAKFLGPAERQALETAFEADRRSVSGLPKEPNILELPMMSRAELDRKLTDQPDEVKTAVSDYLHERYAAASVVGDDWALSQATPEMKEEVESILDRIVPQRNKNYGLFSDSLSVNDAGAAVHGVAQSDIESGKAVVAGLTTGSGAGTVIRIAKELPNSGEMFPWVARHEAIHGLRRMGLFTADEWSALEGAAKTYGWHKATGKNSLEEGIAEAFGAWGLRRQRGEAPLKVDPVIDRIFKKVEDFFARLVETLNGKHKESWEKIFSDIDSGKIGRRDMSMSSAAGWLRRIDPKDPKLLNWQATVNEPWFARRRAAVDELPSEIRLKPSAREKALAKQGLDFKSAPKFEPGDDFSLLGREFAGPDWDSMTIREIADHLAAEQTGKQVTVQPAAVGAAASDGRTLESLTPQSYGLNRIPVVGKWFKATSPALRVLWQDTSLAAKRAVADLVEFPLRTVGNMAGIATASGVPLERLIKTDKLRFEIEVSDAIKQAFVDYRYGDQAPKMAKERAILNDVRGKTDGKLTYADFKTEIAKALYNADRHSDPMIQAAAQRLRGNVLEPVKKKAIEAGLLDEETLAPKGDASFFPRSYNHERIVAQRPVFKDKIANYLAREQENKAAAKERLTELADRHAGLLSDVQRLESRLESIQSKIEGTDTRLSERNMEARRADNRAATVEDRASEIRTAISELEEFLGSMKDELADPVARARMADLEKELSGLKKEAAPISQAEMDRLNKADINEVLPDDVRKAAEIYLGTRRAPKVPNLIDTMIHEGGIKDFSGEVASLIGGPRGRPGLISNKPGAKSLDSWGEALYEMAPEAFPKGRPTPAEVLDIIAESNRGRSPEWFVERSMSQRDRDLQMLATYFEETFDQAGRRPNSIKEFAQNLIEEAGNNPRLLDRLQEKAQAAGQLPGAEADLAGRKSVFVDLQDVISRARKARDMKDQQRVTAGARAQEAGIASTANRGRLGILQDRVQRQRDIQDIYQRAILKIEDMRADIRTKMEKELTDWQGKSSAEAIRSLKSRDEALAARSDAMAAGTYKGRGARLTSADSPVDRAVRKIIESDRDLSPSELGSRADEIIDRILGSPDGRLPYDAASGGPRIGFSGNEPPPRGSLHSREFAIPTNEISDFVEHDVEHVMSNFLRTILPDVALHERYGDVEMRDVFRNINEEYAAKSAGEMSEKARTKLHKERDAVIRDVAAMRDRIRGVYGLNSMGGRNLGRVVRVAQQAGSMMDLGSSALNSASDASGALLRYGLGTVFKSAWEPFFKGVVGLGELSAAQKKQAKAMLIAIETDTNLRGRSMADVIENYRPGSKFERGVQFGADKMQLLNGQSIWTDKMKTMAMSAAQSELLDSAERIAKGKGTQRDVTWLASNNIDPQMAGRIWEHFSGDGGGDMIEGVRFANSDTWKDRQAARMFEAALQREVDIAVVTPGAERPLWMSQPIWALLGQYKGFVAATHERTLLAQLQQMDARTLQGVMGAIGMGMISYRLYTAVSGQKVSERPQDWVKEGISRSGMMGWLDEANAISAKATRGMGDVYRVIGADRPLSKYASRSILSSFLGPAASKIEGTAQVTGAVAGQDWSASNTSQVRRMIPFQNLFYLRNLLNEAESGVNSALGVPERAQ